MSVFSALLMSLKVWSTFPGKGKEHNISISFSSWWQNVTVSLTFSLTLKVYLNINKNCYEEESERKVHAEFVFGNESRRTFFWGKFSGQWETKKVEKFEVKFFVESFRAVNLLDGILTIEKDFDEGKLKKDWKNYKVHWIHL